MIIPKFGITNYLPKLDKYLLFIDLDDVSENEARKEMMRQRCDALLIETQKTHYWIVCLNPLKKSDWLSMYFDSADDMFHVANTKKLGKTVLRMSQKHSKNRTMKLLDVFIVGNNLSRAHLAFFKEFFGDVLNAFNDNKSIDGGIEFCSYFDEVNKNGKG